MKRQTLILLSLVGIIFALGPVNRVESASEEGPFELTYCYLPEECIPEECTDYGNKKVEEATEELCQGTLGNRMTKLYETGHLDKYGFNVLKKTLNLLCSQSN